MRTTRRVLTALIITGLLVASTAAIVTAEGTREACWQQKVGSLRLATDVLPCKSTSENEVLLQIGEPDPPAGGGLSGRVNYSETVTIAKWPYDSDIKDQTMTFDVSCPAGKVSTGAGYMPPIIVDNGGYAFPPGMMLGYRPVGAESWSFLWQSNYASGPVDSYDLTLWVVCVDA